MSAEVFQFPDKTYFLKGDEAAVIFKTEGKNMFETPTATPFALTIQDSDKRRNPKTYRVVPWGDDNLRPQNIIEKVEKSPDLSAGILFNVQAIYGNGIVPVKWEINEKGERKSTPIDLNKYPEIKEFFERNDLNGFLLEQATDLQYFYNVFPEIILNRRIASERKVVELNHKEASFSRWTEASKETGLIEHHIYNADWEYGNYPSDEKAEATEVLNPKRPIMDLMERIGREPRQNGVYKDDQVYRYIMPINFPTPGKTYYQKPYWYSIFESGWYDFAINIPEFKRYMLENSMNIKFIIYISDDYFPDIFAREGITEEEDKKARIAKEYTSFNTYLAGVKNSGKSMISFTKTAPDGKKDYRVEIKKVENDMKGGEYMQDSSEVSNMIAYSLGVHPSLIGAAPGKTGGSMSGTDKRELFNIKQALLKPVRDKLLKPLYLVKAVNQWPTEVDFQIANIEFTTLDEEKTGQKEGINGTN